MDGYDSDGNPIPPPPQLPPPELDRRARPLRRVPRRIVANNEYPFVNFQEPSRIRQPEKPPRQQQ